MLIAMLTAVCARKIANRRRMYPALTGTVMAICDVIPTVGADLTDVIQTNLRTVPVPVASFRFLMLVRVRMVRGSDVFVSCVWLFAPRRRLPRCS